MKRLFLTVGMAAGLVSALIGLAGCEKVVEFKVDEVTPYVVLVSKPEADSMVRIKLSYSRFFLDGHSFRTIRNADVRLYANGRQTNRLSADDGEYFFDCLPQASDTLDLQVLVPGYPMVQAGTRVPAEPDVEVLETAYDSLSQTCQVKVRIHDPQGKNYYRISFDGWIRNITNYYDHNGVFESDTTEPEFISLWFSSSDVVFTDATSVDFLLEQGETSVSGRSLRFSDRLFDGKSYTMVFNLSLGNVCVDLLSDTSQYPYTVCISALSGDRYLYDNTLEKADDEFAILSEPVQIYTNVQGGIGVFAASNNRKIKLKPVFRRIQ